jgi:hypothetical protein
MNMATDILNDPSVRPLVKRHYHKFLAYTKEHGSETIHKLLKNGYVFIGDRRYNLTLLSNRKDIYQMMQLLDMV